MKLAELFLSIQGESSSAGFPTVFIRTAGCNLNCIYCDTAYAREGGTEYSVEKIVEQVMSYDIRRVTITGGEPLQQEELPELCRQLAAKDCTVQIETNGSIDISVLPESVRIILDVKTPGSGMSGHNDPANLLHLKPEDEIKFVITSKADYVWSVAFIRDNHLGERNILFSPAAETCSGKDLAAWIIYDRLDNVRLQLQLHKMLWPGEQGR